MTHTDVPEQHGRRDGDIVITTAPDLPRHAGSADEVVPHQEYGARSIHAGRAWRRYPLPVPVPDTGALAGRLRRSQSAPLGRRRLQSYGTYQPQIRPHSHRHDRVRSHNPRGDDATQLARAQTLGAPCPQMSPASWVRTAPDERAVRWRRASMFSRKNRIVRPSRAHGSSPQRASA